MQRFDSFEDLTVTSSHTNFNLQSVEVNEGVLAIEMKNKIPSYSSSMMLS